MEEKPEGLSSRLRGKYAIYICKTIISGQGQGSVPQCRSGRGLWSSAAEMEFYQLILTPKFRICITWLWYKTFFLFFFKCWFVKISGLWSRRVMKQGSLHHPPASPQTGRARLSRCSCWPAWTAAATPGSTCSSAGTCCWTPHLWLLQKHCQHSELKKKKV